MAAPRAPAPPPARTGRAGSPPRSYRDPGPPARPRPAPRRTHPCGPRFRGGATSSESVDPLARVLQHQPRPGLAADGFHLPEDQAPSRRERVGEGRDDAFLGATIEVNDHVAAQRSEEHT